MTSRRARGLLVALTLALLPGCAAENLRDWSEVLIIRGSAGVGARASVRLGGFAHPGIGADVSVEAGLSHGPYAGVHGDLEAVLFHAEQCQNAKREKGDGAARDCKCAGLALPLATCKGRYDIMQIADLEVSVFVGVVGIGVGISFAELVDAITNTFGLDLDPVKEDAPPLHREKQ